MLEIGERMPDVELRGEGGEPVRLRDRLGRGPLVVYFYPRDETPGCVAEACAFRDAWASFVEAGAAVIGISDDPPESHRRFRERRGLPFELLSDTGGSARRAFGVGRTLGILPGRATFVFDREGVVRYAFSSQLRPAEHVRRALAEVERLAARAPGRPSAGP